MAAAAIYLIVIACVGGIALLIFALAAFFDILQNDDD